MLDKGPDCTKQTAWQFLHKAVSCSYSHHRVNITFTNTPNATNKNLSL